MIPIKKINLVFLHTQHTLRQPGIKYSGLEPTTFQSQFSVANHGLFHSVSVLHIQTNNFLNKYPSSLLCWDSISQPLEHVSLAITNRPVANLNKHITIVNYDARVVMTTNLPILRT